MKIYIAGAISGQPVDDVFSYFKEVQIFLANVGYTVYSPMLGKAKFRNEMEFQPHGYKHDPIITNHAIVERDRWMVNAIDLVYCNLTMCNGRVSIGSVMELAWAHQLGKHTVVAMEEGNIHHHAFVLEAADIIFETHESALDYLKTLISIESGY